MSDRFTNMHDLIQAFAGALNLTIPDVQDHHQRVAYIAYRLAEAMELPDKDRHNIIYGAIMHDVGSVAEEGDLALTDVERRVLKVAKAGSRILEGFPAFRHISETVLNSQARWDKLSSRQRTVGGPLLYGQVIKLADHVSLMLDGDGPILDRLEKVKSVLHCAEKGVYRPDVLDAFDRISAKAYIWLDIYYRPDHFLDFIPENRDVSLEETMMFTRFVSQLIDFRSPFTAMHSAGVAASAEKLARLIGMSDDECRMMLIAGYLHDLGKLKIPASILEKPGKLTDSEFNTVKEHAYYTHVLLKDIEGFAQICDWASFHHEKLDGSGYPFALTAGEIPIGSRIMAVADIFSAITEERPYRKGMEKAAAVEVLRGSARSGAISGIVTDLLLDNYAAIDEARAAASEEAGKRYFGSISAKRE